MKYTSLSQVPDKIVYQINYSDGSGPKLKITLSASKEVLISQHEDPAILLGYEDIEWLRDVLSDMKKIRQLYTSWDYLELPDNLLVLRLFKVS